MIETDWDEDSDMIDRILTLEDPHEEELRDELGPGIPLMVTSSPTLFWPARGEPLALFLAYFTACLDTLCCATTFGQVIHRSCLSCAPFPCEFYSSVSC